MKVFIRKIVVLLCLSALIVFVIGLPISIYVNRSKRLITDIKLVDHCAAGNLDSLGVLADKYAAEYGAYPESLEQLVSTESIRKGSSVSLSPVQPPPDYKTLDQRYAELLKCPADERPLVKDSYIYRGSDLPKDPPKEMIIAYDRAENHRTVRNVLFARATTDYSVDQNDVSKDTYKNTFMQYLKNYERGVEIKIRGYSGELNLDSVTHSKGYLVIDTSSISEETFNSIAAKILEDIDQGKLDVQDMVNVMVFNETGGFWQTKCWAVDRRVYTLNSAKFKAAIAKDNELRTKLGLPIKEPQD